MCYNVHKSKIKWLNDHRKEDKMASEISKLLRPTLKAGLYEHNHYINYVEGTMYAGRILLFVKETKHTFILTLKENSVRYDAPQIDDMFFYRDTLIINKEKSQHALVVHADNEFTLFPYQIGEIYAFKRFVPKSKFFHKNT